MDNNQKIAKDYWDMFAQAFIHPITSDGLLSKFVANPDITGAYAESYIRHLTKSMLPLYRISTGAVIRPMDKLKGLKSIPQCDIIIWDPSELPALFEQDNFALVSSFSARAIIEVKRTCTDISKFQSQLISLQKRLTSPDHCNILGIIVNHPKSLFSGITKADWLKDKNWKSFPPMTRLMDKKGNVDTDGVFTFIYFLSQIAGHSKLVK